VYSRAWFRTAGITVRLVDGEAVRNQLSVEFIGGGHARRYPFIPEGEIWIEETLSPGDRAATIVHEAAEYRLMGRGTEYEWAHREASSVERKFRETYGDAPPPDDKLIELVRSELIGG
jgi:hypothetical protein